MNLSCRRCAGGRAGCGLPYTTVPHLFLPYLSPHAIKKTGGECIYSVPGKQRKLPPPTVSSRFVTHLVTVWRSVIVATATRMFLR